MHSTVDADRWSRVQRAFHEALSRDVGARDDFLAELSREDSLLADEVRSLLEAHHRTGPLAGIDGTDIDTLRDALADHYDVQHEIGVGGMARVFLGRDRKHDRQVAIKVLRSDVGRSLSAERFLQEIRVTANLQHPHILPLHDSGEADGFLYYVMPFVEGLSLRHELLEHGALQVAFAVEIVRQVAGALDFAHRRNVVHRDIKPENILLQEGVSLVADFGIAFAAASAGSPRMTGVAVPIGTPAYMSPEQASGQPEPDGRTDVYGLGCVLFECLTGSPPYRAPTIQAVMVQHLNAPIPSAASFRNGIPDHVSAAVQRALAKDRAERFSTALEFANAITGVDSHQHVSSPKTATAPSIRTHGFSTPRPNVPTDQEIRFCTAQDGVNIAYAKVGAGPPLVKAANWLSHLEFDWQSPIWRHWWEGLASQHTVFRYDERGCGLSDWDVAEIGFEAWVRDLEAVVDAVGLDQFALLGVSQGGPIAIAYALRHPDRVSKIVLHGSYARGRDLRPTAPEKRLESDVMNDLIRVGWGHDNPAFRQVFSLMFYPEASPEQLRWLNELMRVSCSAENAIRMNQVFGVIDVRDLAPQVQVPTLVLHCKDDARVPFEEGRLLASLIPSARLVPLPSKNHIPLEDEPAWPQFLDAVHTFLADGNSSAQ